MEIWIYITNHWLEWLFAALLGLLGWGYKTVAARLKEEQEKNAAISSVQALLRESIVTAYNKYNDPDNPYPPQAYNTEMTIV